MNNLQGFSRTLDTCYYCLDEKIALFILYPPGCDNKILFNVFRTIVTIATCIANNLIIISGPVWTHITNDLS